MNAFWAFSGTKYGTFSITIRVEKHSEKQKRFLKLAHKGRPRAKLIGVNLRNEPAFMSVYYTVGAVS